MDKIGIQGIEIISVGETKIAAYAVGQGVWHLSDWNGMNMRVKKLSPLFDRDQIEECKKWLIENFDKLDYVKYVNARRSRWEINSFGNHYENTVSAKGREVLGDMQFNAYAIDPFALSAKPA